MSLETIQDHGRGPEIAGTRITVYSLLHSLLDPTVTEAEIGRIYALADRQVAVARAYVLAHAETVLAEYLKIEERLAAGNPPEVQHQAELGRAALQDFRRYLAEQEAANGCRATADTHRPAFPTFREWLATHESR